MEYLPPGYQYVSFHIIFYVNMGENFKHKSQIVSEGNNTTTPSNLTYSSVVSQDSARIDLKISALNYLRVITCDIQNVYLTTKCREKIWTVTGTTSL